MDVRIRVKSALQIIPRICDLWLHACVSVSIFRIMYIITSYHLKMKFIVHVEERHRSSPSAITSYIEIRTCIEHYATRAIYARNYVLLASSVWIRTRGRLPGTSPFSITRYYISTLITMFVIKLHRWCARRKSEPNEINGNLHRGTGLKSPYKSKIDWKIDRALVHF